jgi:transposase-like protein
MAEQTSSLSEVAPTCPKCGSPLVLKRLLSGRIHYKGKFECDSCGRSVTRVIELASTQSPPLASASPAEES